MDKFFLLCNETAKMLYKEIKCLPIVDYHNHLSIGDITSNKRYTDIYDLWIKPDPYKHRAMRMCGIEEKYITGNASDFEKFEKWCKCVPCLVGNPLYQWTKMELFEIFGIDEMPNERNASEIYNMCNKFLAENDVTPEIFFKKFNVEVACPCASILDDTSAFDFVEKAIPSLRCDDIVNADKNFCQKLSDVTNIKIADLNSYKEAVRLKIKEFYNIGCRFSDHALDNGFKFYDDDGKNEERFIQMLNGDINSEDKERLFSYLLTFLSAEYAKYEFVLQLHIGAQRYTSTRLRNVAGAAGGFAGIGNSVDVNSLTKFLDAVDSGKYGLPKTVLFTLNPADNALISVLSGSYSKDGVKGLVTQGPAWWWCDHKQGIKEMLENTAVFSLLSNFIGMTTDSRSFLSFVRHDYFRRILCDFLGEKFENGDFGCGEADLKEILTCMCYKNAKIVLGGKDNDF